MVKPPKIGRVGIWTSSGLWKANSDDLPDAAAELDQLGYGALWLGSSTGDLALHSAVLAATTRLVVASGIINIWIDSPTMVADSFQRVATTYPDRILIGLGSSHAPLVKTEQYHRPLARLSRYLVELDQLSPTVPTDRRVLAALGPKTLALAAQRSAGAHPYLTTPQHTAEARDILGHSAVLAPEQKVILETNPTTARAIARNTLHQYLQLPNYTSNFLRMGFSPDDLEHGGSDRLIDGLIAWGNTDAVIKRISEHHAAGADHVAIQFLTAGDRHSGPLPRQQWRTLAAAL
jgi:probable F420-dependent oxidoreductase